MTDFDREVIRAAVREAYWQGYRSALGAVQGTIGDVAATVDAMALRGRISGFHSQLGRGLAYQYGDRPNDGVPPILLYHGVALGRSPHDWPRDKLTPEQQETARRMAQVEELTADAGRRWP